MNKTCQKSLFATAPKILPSVAQIAHSSLLVRVASSNTIHFEKDIALRVEMRFVINESLLALKLEYFDHYHAFTIFATRNWSYIVFERRGETRTSIAAMTRCLRQAKLLYIKPILLNEEGRFLIKCLRNSSGVARINK